MEGQIRPPDHLRDSVESLGVGTVAVAPLMFEPLDKSSCVNEGYLAHGGYLGS